MSAKIIKFPKRKKPQPIEPIPLPLLLFGAVLLLMLVQR